MKTLYLFLLLTFPFFSFCQKKQDYIVLKGETVYGFIEYDGKHFNPSFVLFRKSENESFKKYTPLEISKLYLRALDMIFVSKKTVNNDAYFFATGRDKKILLLYQETETIVYADYDEASVFQLDNNGIIKDNLDKDLLRRMLLKDCAPENPNYRLAKNNKRKLKKLISLPGYCTNKRLNFLKFGIYNSLTLNSISDTYLNGSGNINFGWNLGVFSEFPINKNGRLNLVPSIHWSSINYANSTKRNEGEYDRENIRLSLNQTEVPLLVRYYLKDKKLPLFIDIGGSYIIRKNYEIESYLLKTSNDLVEVFEHSPDPLSFSKNGVNALVGIGTRIFISYRMAIFTELRYAHSFGITNSKTNLKTRGLELTLRLSL